VAKRRKRLLWQLYPTYLLITILSLGAATWFASRTLKQFYLEERATDLEARARLFETQILAHLSPLNTDAIAQLCRRIGEQVTTRVTVILPLGEVICDSEKDPETMDSHVDRPEIREALRGRVGISTRYSRTLGKDMMYVGIPLKEDSDIIGVLRTSVPLTSIDEALRSIEIKIVVGGLSRLRGHQVADHFPRGFTLCPARNSHRSHLGDQPGRRGDRADYVYCGRVL
jgi:two-component system phosphate regulon sensor histidine kinase PhoR